MIYIPLTATPLGWLILGAGGYALYRAGKKKGAEETVAAQITEAPEPDTKKSKKTKTKGDK